MASRRFAARKYLSSSDCKSSKWNVVVNAECSHLSRTGCSAPASMALATASTQAWTGSSGLTRSRLPRCDMGSYPAESTAITTSPGIRAGLALLRAGMQLTGHQGEECPRRGGLGGAAVDYW